MRAVNAETGQVLSTRLRRTTVPQVVALIAGSGGVCRWRETTTKCL